MNANTVDIGIEIPADLIFSICRLIHVKSEVFVVQWKKRKKNYSNRCRYFFSIQFFPHLGNIFSGQVFTSITSHERLNLQIIDVLFMHYRMNLESRYELCVVIHSERFFFIFRSCHRKKSIEFLPLQETRWNID